MTLTELEQHFHQMYTLRNQLCIGDGIWRIIYLNHWARCLQKAIRKGNTEDIKSAIANIVGWIFALTDCYRIKLAHSMAQKYPQGTCSYCNRTQCQCTEQRLPA